MNVSIQNIRKIRMNTNKEIDLKLSCSSNISFTFLRKTLDSKTDSPPFYRQISISTFKIQSKLQSRKLQSIVINRIHEIHEIKFTLRTYFEYFELNSRLLY